MANIRSAKKRIRRTVHQAAVNKNRVSGVRTSIKQVEQAILNDDAAAAKTAFQDAQPMIMRGAQRGIMHRNNQDGILKTPTVFINGTKVEGIRPLDEFVDIIEAALARSKAASE